MNKEKQQRLLRLLSGGLFLFLGMLISILNVLPDLDPQSVLHALIWVLLGLGALMEISALGITGAVIGILYTLMYPIRYKITDWYGFLPHIVSFSLMIALMLLRDKAVYFSIGSAICRIMPVIHDAVLWVQELGWKNMGEFWRHSWSMIVLSILVMTAILLAGFGFQKYKAEPLRKTWMSPKGSSADKLAKLMALREKGAISDEEYEQQKQRLLGEEQ